MRFAGRVLLLSPVAALCVVWGGEPGPREVAGLESWLTPGRVFLLGEVHGTAQSPAFAASVAAAAVASDLDVVVGLELSSLVQSSLDDYVASEGGPDDRKALLAHPVWQSSYQDGRTSTAMFELIESVRRIGAASQGVRIVAFDVAGAGSGQHRERLMARRLARSARNRPDAVHIVLTGNRHSRTVTGSRRDAGYEPMGYLLQNEIGAERLLALDVAHGGGTAWVCAPDCGVVQLRERYAGTPWSIEVSDETRPSGHRGWYHAGGLTASPPAAVEVDLAAPPSSRSRTGKVTQPEPQRSSTEPADSPAVQKLQGRWQAYQYGSKAWRIRFDGLSFYAEVGPDDWYKGEIAVRLDKEPAQIDFHIEDCRCAYKGRSSAAIYRWDDETMIVAAPQPGSPRPRTFDRDSGQVVDLRRVRD